MTQTSLATQPPASETWTPNLGALFVDFYGNPTSTVVPTGVFLDDSNLGPVLIAAAESVPPIQLLLGANVTVPITGPTTAGAPQSMVAVMTIGEVTTLPPNSQATASITGSVLNLGLPTGPQGLPGMPGQDGAPGISGTPGTPGLDGQAQDLTSVTDAIQALSTLVNQIATFVNYVPAGD